MNVFTRSITPHGFIDRHPIAVPATIFLIAWIPYLIIFLRRTIAFGTNEGVYAITTWQYWLLWLIQLGVCVISHSLTVRTIIRLYAPNWLIWGSIALYSLLPAWGLLTAADIRHPLFAAVFCVFISSLTFMLYSKHTTLWLWIQLGGGALAVCLLRDDGTYSVIPALILLCIVMCHRTMQTRHGSMQPAIPYMHATNRKTHESYRADVSAAFLVLSAVILYSVFVFFAHAAPPLGQPTFTNTSASAPLPRITFGMNMTGNTDIAGILPAQEIATNSIFPSLAGQTAHLFAIQQQLPILNITFSWIAYALLCTGFSLAAVIVLFRRADHHDYRPAILAVPLMMIVLIACCNPADSSLRYLMPVLAAQPMMFGAYFASSRGFIALE